MLLLWRCCSLIAYREVGVDLRHSVPHDWACWLVHLQQHQSGGAARQSLLPQPLAHGCHQPEHWRMAPLIRGVEADAGPDDGTSPLIAVPEVHDLHQLRPFLGAGPFVAGGTAELDRAHFQAVPCHVGSRRLWRDCRDRLQSECHA